MAIRGNLSEASLADVLQLLALGQKTGCLSIAGQGRFGTMHFVAGRVVHAAIVNRRDRLGDRLVRLGVMAADDLARVLASLPEHDDRLLARTLLERGTIERAIILDEFRQQLEEVAYHLFGWTHGMFTFEPDGQGRADPPFFSVNVDSLLLEGARRVDEWTQIEKKIPSLDSVFEMDADRLAGREVPLSKIQELIAPMLDGTQDVASIVERSGLGEFEVAKALYGLLSAGYVQRVGRSAARRQPPPESRIAEHRNLGTAFYRTGMLDEAEREFHRVLELRDADGVALFHLGLVHARRGAWRDAVGAFSRAADAAEAPAAVHHNLAFCTARLGDMAQAGEYLAEAEHRSGAMPDPRVALTAAQLAIADNDLVDADRHLARARGQWGSRQPSAAWFHMAGLCAALSGDHIRAVAILEEGLNLHPHAIPLHNNLAVVQERRGSHEAAARTVEHALLENPNSAHLHKNLGDYYYRFQRYDEACDSFTRVVRLAPRHGSDVYLKLGNIAYRRGLMDEARAAWEQALMLDPESRIVHSNLTALLGGDHAPDPVLAGVTG